jgi:hypothetical protein
VLVKRYLITEAEAKKLKLPCKLVSDKQLTEGALVFVGTKLSKLAQQLRKDVIDRHTKDLRRFWGAGHMFYQLMYVNFIEHPSYGKLIADATKALEDKSLHPTGFEKVCFTPKKTAALFATKFIKRIFSYIFNVLVKDIDLRLQALQGGKNKKGHLSFRATKVDSFQDGKKEEEK